jgi:hypothetical protein
LQVEQNFAGGRATRITETDSVFFDICESNLIGHHANRSNPSLIGDREWQTKAMPGVKPMEETVVVGRDCMVNDLNITSQGGVNNCNDVVGEPADLLIELAMPTFEDLPHQNAQSHLNALNEYLVLKNIPQRMHKLRHRKKGERRRKQELLIETSPANPAVLPTTFI